MTAAKRVRKVSHKKTQELYLERVEQTRRQQREQALAAKQEPELSEEQRLWAECVERWRAEGPAGFAVDALGMAPEWDHELPADEQRAVVPWWWEASEKLVAQRKMTLRSGHGATKSAFMAITSLWFIACYFPCKVPCTAPTGHQLADILWPEIAKWLRVMKEHMPFLEAQYEWSKSGLRLKAAPEESFAVPRTARPEKPEALQGFHADNLLFIIDEASGVAEQVFEVAQGALSTEGAFVLLAGNPTRTTGFFYDTHCKKGVRERYAHVHVNCEDRRRAPLVSKSYVEDIAAKYGKDSNYYRVRVKGEFPTQDDDAVMSLADLEDAQNRDVAQFGTMIWGLDVARFGNDRCALAKRHGNHQHEKVKTWTHHDTMATANRVYREWQETKPHLRPYRICVDIIGLGAGVADRLREMGLPVADVNVAEAPAGRPDLYRRLRDELWFACAEWVKQRVGKLRQDDDTLVAELCSVKYKFDAISNRIVVESKEEMKKRGLISPDVADAWCLTYAMPTATVRTPQSQPLEPEGMDEVID